MDRRTYLMSAVAALPALRLTAAASSSAEVAETSNGKVRGEKKSGVLRFRGIPYGAPVDGAARFLPPARAKKWTGIREATANGPRCTQMPGNLFLSDLLGEYFGGGRADRVELATQSDSENCLVLNVLTPSRHGRRPVMVYIHGGGYTSGSGVLTAFADRHVLEQDLVMVGINHRLNVFGYTYLGGLTSQYATGNAGQLDLILALEWVRDNIGRFGGDKDNVTIFGESGGGLKIATLMAMPAAKGLFHKACVQSGAGFRVADPDEATSHARDLLGKLGLSKPEDLQTVPAMALVKAGSGGGLLGNGPVVDGQSLLRQPWDPDAPSLAAGVPMIIGNCKDESTLFLLGQEDLYRLDENGLRAALMKAGVPASRVDEVTALYRRSYPHETPSDLFFRISADRGARWNAAKQAELQLKNGGAKVFVYYFQWNTPVMGGKLRAFHTADLPLTMRLVRYPESESLSRLLSGAWGAFARNGDPSQTGFPWPSYTVAERATMVFGLPQSGAVNDPDRDERLLLRDINSGVLL